MKLKNFRALASVAFVLTIAGGVGVLWGGQKIPAVTQIPLLVKALGYLKTYAASPAPEFHLVIVDDGKVGAAELKEVDAAFSQLKSTKINGKPMIISTVKFTNAVDLAGSLKLEKAAAVYIPWGADESIPKILQVTREAKILSIGASADYSRRGVTLGIDFIDGKPKLVVNLAGCMMEGVEFSSQLLKISDVRF